MPNRAATHRLFPSAAEQVHSDADTAQVAEGSRRDQSSVAHRPASVSRTTPVDASAHPRLGRYGRLEEQYHQMLLEKDASIEELREKIRRLEQTERRVKRQRIVGNDLLANKEAELCEIRKELHSMEDKADEQEKTIEELTAEAERYRRWWVNEFYCLKVALGLARDPNDAGVKAMWESSHARFLTWSAENNFRVQAQ